MKLVLTTGEVKDVDTGHIFDNQYNTTDGDRIFDTAVHHTIDDIRLGEFYCSSVKQGTYGEVAQAIADTRANINKCEGCWWFHEHNLIGEESSRNREEVKEGNKSTVLVTEKRVYEISCAYVPKYVEKCIYDIDEKPILFREKNFCFFCEYPQGVPNMQPLKEFMLANAEKYGIVPYWGDQELSINNRFKYKKPFGSYIFETASGSMFELSNSRNRFLFYIDMKNKKFILHDSIGYKVRKYLGENVYNHTTNKSSYMPIKNYDKFAAWLWQIVDDFNAQEGLVNDN